MKNVQMSGAIAALVVAASAPAFAADVEIQLTEVRGAAGPLYVALQTREQFMGNGGEYSARLEAPAAGEHVLTIKNVAPGDYAVSVWHDIDADGVFDRDEVGRPLDGVAMSGPPVMGPPSYDGAKISVPKEGLSVSLRMAYYGG